MPIIYVKQDLNVDNELDHQRASRFSAILKFLKSIYRYEMFRLRL